MRLFEWVESCYATLTTSGVRETISLSLSTEGAVLQGIRVVRQSCISWALVHRASPALLVNHVSVLQAVDL